MTFGPQLSQNYMYQLIKQQMNDFIVEDVISIYVANNRKDARMQLGGYEVTNARGHGNGVLFYVMPVTVSSDEKHWLLEVARIACSR